MSIWEIAASSLKRTSVLEATIAMSSLSLTED